MIGPRKEHFRNRNRQALKPQALMDGEKPDASKEGLGWHRGLIHRPISNCLLLLWLGGRSDIS